MEHVASAPCKEEPHVYQRSKNHLPWTSLQNKRVWPMKIKKIKIYFAARKKKEKSSSSRVCKQPKQNGVQTGMEWGKTFGIV